MSYDDLVQQVAVVLHDEWKRFARSLLLWGRLGEAKANQYDRGLCPFEELEPYYRNTYTTQARDIVQLCVEYLKELEESK